MTKALIVGANRGIGLEVVKQLVARGDDVVAVCRHTSEALKEAGAEVHDGIDITEDAQVATLAGALSKRRFGMVLLNAGILERTSLDELDLESVRRQIEVNAIAPLRLAAALRGCFDNPCKLGLTTSRMGSIEDNTSGGSYGYRMSKAALNAAGRSLAHDLAPAGVSVGLLHPGWVRTDMTGNTGNVEASEAAAMLIERLDALAPGNTGRFWHANGEELPW